MLHGNEAKVLTADEVKTPCEEQHRIRAFPRNAVMDRKTLKVKIKINWPRVSAVISDKQYTCSIVKVFCFSSSETFSVAIAAALL